ncbi:MAG: hypothetical protein AAF988_06350 [Pseudomonadota bacterium]
MKYLLFIFAISTIFTSVDSLAQESQVFQKPNHRVVNEALQQLEQQQQQIEATQGFITPQKLDVSIVEYDYFEPGQFGILIETDDLITGCWNRTPLEYEASFTEQFYLDILVKHYRRLPGDENCATGGARVSALVILTKENMTERAIRQIRFSNGSARDRYDFSLSGDSISLKPLSSIAFHPKNGTSVAYNSNQRKIIALHVPMAKEGDNLSSEILRLARQNNLSVLGQDLSGEFAPNQNTFYFMDMEGLALEKLGSNDYIDVGVVQVQRPYDGPYGRTTIEKPLKVFATRAGNTL